MEKVHFTFRALIFRIPLTDNFLKVLRTKSPFAHRALVQSLVDILPENTHDDIPRPEGAFNFISRPIQRLFLRPRTTLKTLLNILDVLAVRFRRQYIDSHIMNRTLTFDTELVLLEDYYHFTAPEDLALRLTERDLALAQTDNMTATQSNIITRADRLRCIVENIVANDVMAHRVMDSWNALSNSVGDCCVALSNIVPRHLYCFLLNSSCLTKF